MTKRRMIYDCLWKSEDLAKFTYRQRLLWIGLITTADDQGRGSAIPGLIRSVIFPYDDISFAEIELDMEALINSNMIIVYEANEKAYYQIKKWWEYQKPQWAGPSDFPAPGDWLDRLRYHGKEHVVITENWGSSAKEERKQPEEPYNLPPEEPPDLLGNSLGEEKPNQREKEKEKEKEDLKTYGDEKTSPDETEKPKRKPSEKNKTRTALEQHFSELTGLPVPKTDTQGQRKSAGSLWWSPIREMAELCEWNRERSMQLMDLTVAHLKKSGMTVSSPKSIVNTAKAVATGNVPGVKFSNNGNNGERRTEIRRIQDPFTKEWREQEVRI